MRRPSTAAASAVLAIALAVNVTAKGETIRLIVAGPGLRAPLDVTDPAALANVWAGTFIGRPAAEPDPALPRYVVSFVVKPPREPHARTMYVVTFVVDRDSRRGFVYLPGRGEDGFRMNAASIMRDGQDGHWHEASAPWSGAIARQLHRADREH